MVLSTTVSDAMAIQRFQFHLNDLRDKGSRSVEYQIRRVSWQKIENIDVSDVD